MELTFDEEFIQADKDGRDLVQELKEIAEKLLRDADGTNND